MDIKKIYTFGDGYAMGHIWPEWPQLLQAIYPKVEVVNTAGIGAGNEFLLNAALQTPTDGIFIMQWASPRRLDKLINTARWNTIINTDPVYSQNTVKLGDNNWWLSSSSTQSEVAHYHDFYIEETQANLRTYNYMLLLKNYFNNNNIQYYYMFTYSPEYLSLAQKNTLTDANWAWHKPWAGMSEYSTQPKYNNIRQTEVQPSPAVHLNWLVECLLHKLPFKLDNTRLINLKTLVDKEKWVPFYWDRKAQWENLLSMEDE
jgi:hypothetical protein